MNLLNSYMNGNVKVSIYDDGTKIREYDGVPQPIHFESADCKITNKCNGNCNWCHEMSDINGQHADLNKLLNVLKDIPAGTELALGGGNPLLHPDLYSFLVELHNRGIISNMTINQKHIAGNKELLYKLINEKLIYGLGISYSDPKYFDDIAMLINLTDNIVFHVIMGINEVEVIEELNQFCNAHNKQCKALMLGYKNYGNGNLFYLSDKDKIEQNKQRWYWYIAKYFKHENLTLSFDNLAIKQLNLKRFFSEEAWDKFFQGRDGTFTQYIDAVKQQYAESSCCNERVSFDDMSLLDYFQSISRKNIKNVQEI